MNTKNASRTKKDDVKSGSCLTTNMNDVFQLPPVLHNQIQIVRTNESCFKDYSILGSLGKGTYAQVWKVKHKLTNEIYAAKLLQPSQFPKESFNRIVEMFTKEIINLSICQCPGVVKLHKVIGGKEGWVLIQDFVNDGTLWKENLTNSMEEAFLYFIQLFQGMCYIQDMNIVHRDLKPTNILKQDNKKIVIADFGWSEHVDSCNLHPSEWPGTLEINPPEVLRNTGPMTEKIDNYALGMNMILFVSGRFVCRQKGVECSKVAQTILRTVHNLRHSKPPSKFRDNLKAWDLFVKLTSSNPSERISLEKVLYHPWVTEMLNNLSIQNSKFIWYEKVKSRWIFLLSNNWNFFKSMSTQTSKSTKQLQTENVDLSKKNNENKRVNNVDNNAVIKTRSEDRENGHKVDTVTVDVTKETQKNVEANGANKDEYDNYAAKKNCKNKNEEFSLDKNEKRSIEKERKTRHPVSIAATNQEKEQNKERERTKVAAKPVNHESVIKDTFKQECENIIRNKNEERKCNCETANINVGSVMGKLQKQETKEIRAEEEEDEEYEEDDDDENDDDDGDDDDDNDDDDDDDDEEDEEDDDDDDDDDDEEEEEEDEEEEDEEDEVEEEKDAEYKNKLSTKDKKNELGVIENVKDSKTCHYNDRKEISHLLQKNTTVSVAKEGKNCSNKIIDNAFMNFVETKNLNISKDLMKNDLLEKINKLAERTLEENRRKNEGSQQTEEQKNMFNSSRKHDNYIKRLTRNFQANKVKTPQFFGGNMMNGRNSKDMSLLFGRPKNQKKIASEFKNRNGMDESKEDPYSQNEEAIRNRLKVSVDGIYPNVNFKNSFENLDLNLKKEMEKIDKLYKNTKEIGNDKLFSCQREHITTPGNELNVDHLSEMEKFINNEKIGNTGRFEIENNEGDIEASPEVYENIIEKCLKKTNDKAFSKYGTLLEKKKINKTNTLVHKLFNRNVELMFDERNDERERTTTVPLEQYRISMKCNSENVQRDEDGYNDVSDKNETNGNKYKTNIPKEFSLDAELNESTDQCRFPHNKTKEKNNSLIYSSKRTLHPTYVTDIFENNEVSNRKNAYNDGTGSNNTVTNERIYKTELPYGKNDSLSKQDKETVKTFTHLSNEYNNNYCDKSKVSSSTINSNGSSDANNSIIDNFVNNTKTEKTESVYHSGYFDASRDNSSTEDKKLHTFLCKSKVTHKANVDTAKTQEFLMEDISDCNTAWDLNRKSNALDKLKSYDQSSVDSAKITSKDRKKSEDKKKNTYIANQTEEKTFMNGKDKSDNLIFKSSDKKTYEEMLLEELSRKLQNKSITKTPSNEKIKQMEVHENKSLHHQLLNNPQYQKLISTYSEESSSALLNKLKSQEYTTNMYNNHIRNTTYGNEKSNAYQYINGQVSNANSYTKSTLYLNDNSKENVGKTFSASTFECSDFDIHYSSNKELIESFNSDYNFVSKDKYLFESKKKQQNNFVQLK